MSDALGIDSVVEDITPILQAAGCYERRDAAIRMVCPDYGPDHLSKIVLPSVVDSESLRLYSVVVQAPDGKPILAYAPDAPPAVVLREIAGKVARKLAVLAESAPKIADANITWVSS